MDIVQVAVIIVAVALAWLAHWAAARAGASASVCFALGLLVALLIYTAGPAVLAL